MAYIQQRLNRLERKQTGDFGEIIQLIREGTFYDELDEKQKEQYSLYKASLGGCDRDLASAELQIMFLDMPAEKAYHFKLSKREKPPTKEQLQQSVAEVTSYVEELQEKYNSPEAKAKREADYQELRRIGQLRKQAFINGECMDKYPLPF